MLKLIEIKFFLVFIIFCSFLNADEMQEKKYAPNFILEDLEGELFELKEELGTGPILICFWATWCKPCVEEMIHYNKIFNEYDEKGLKFFAISIDKEKTVMKVKPYIKSRNYQFPVLLDQEGEAARKLYVRSIPFSLILNEEGEIVYSHQGFKKGDEKKVIEIVEDFFDE